MSMKLPDALRRFREYVNITQKQAARAANTSERTYQSYEYGKATPSATALIALADYFDVSLDFLVGRGDDPERHYKGAEYASAPPPASRRLAAKMEKLSDREREAVIVFIDALDGLKKIFSETGKDPP